MKAIEVKGLSKTFKSKVKEKGLKGSLKAIFKPKYKDKKAVNKIDFSVEKGEILAFIGPNGAGKSTTIRTVMGLINKTSGDIFINGKETGNPVSPNTNCKILTCEFQMQDHHRQLLQDTYMHQTLCPKHQSAAKVLRFRFQHRIQCCYSIP